MGGTAFVPTPRLIPAHVALPQVSLPPMGTDTFLQAPLQPLCLWGTPAHLAACCCCSEALSVPNPVLLMGPLRSLLSLLFEIPTEGVTKQGDLIPLCLIQVFGETARSVFTRSP